MNLRLDRHPQIVAVAGPNGAGKSTFFESQLRPAGLRFVNADAIALEFGIDAYAAAEMAGRLRAELITRRESFVFETVLSDPAGEKVEQLRRAAESGYTVVLCFIGVESAAVSDDRVALRTSQGGHDVPTDKLAARYPRTLANLKRAIAALPHVYVFDNSDLTDPFRFVAEYEQGKLTQRDERVPAWFRVVLDSVGS